MGKIEEGRKKFSSQNDKREPLLSCTSQQNALKIAILEEKLRNYHDVIHNLQVQSVSKNKVILPDSVTTFHLESVIEVLLLKVLLDYDHSFYLQN